MKNTTILFLGGLGNQLFQFTFMVYMEKVMGASCAYNISYHKKVKVHSGFEANCFFDFSPYKESKKDYYSLRYRIWRKLKSKLHFKGKRVLCDDENFLEGTLFKAYEGYWQDIRFYSAVKDTLKKRFLGIDKFCADQQLLDTVKGCNSVFLHVRRGDYCNDPKYLNLCATNYYTEAIAYIKKNIPDARFFVFSDDIIWSRSFFCDQSDFNFVSYEGQTPLGDLALMLACKNAIIANSSFSWWGTVFDSKNLVIYPATYYTSGRDCPLYFEAWHSITPQKNNEENL